MSPSARRSRKVSAILGVVAGVALLAACGNDSADDAAASTSSATSTSTTSTFVHPTTRSTMPGSPQIPAEWPQDIPVVSGGTCRMAHGQTGADILEVRGLGPSAFDAAVSQLEAAGFAPITTVDPPGQAIRSASLSRSGTIVMLSGSMMGSEYVLVYGYKHA